MATERIEADCNTLMEQAPATATATLYFDEAVKTVEAKFGAGSAKQFPQLVAELVRASSADFHSTAMVVVAQRLEDSLDDFCHAYRQRHDLI